jgi:glycosyltransferase involved in cell wall biosynthesis
MSEQSPYAETKFTVIVPTRERASTLHYCLKTLVTQDYENFEILVSDNFSQDNTVDVVAKFNDSRIRYINTGKRISMSHNWEFALAHVTDGWVLFVGDDDGLVPGGLRVLDTAIQATRCEAVTTASCTYWWPHHFPSMADGELTIPLPTVKPFMVMSSAAMLEKVMQGQAAYRDLPWLYNGGAASIDLINRLRAPDGQYFRSLNPDIYSAITLSLGTENYTAVNVPIAINGASKHSGGTSHMLGQKQDKESPTSKFLAEANIPFHQKLVFGKSIQIMAYECYLQAGHLYAVPAFDMHSQLKAALTAAPKSHLQEIDIECMTIALRNGIAMPNKASIAGSRIIFKSRAFVQRLRQRRSITLPAAQLGAMDVWLASKAISHIYEMFDYFSRRSRLSRLAVNFLVFSTSLSRYATRVIAKFQRHTQ